MFSSGRDDGRLSAAASRVLVAGVIGAAGSLTLAAPAPAYPPQGSECTQFGFKGPQPFEANGNPRETDDGTWRLTFPSVGTRAAGPAAVFFFNTAETVTGHVVSGGIDGRDIDFRVRFDDKPDNVWEFTGTVDDHGTARGTETLAGGGRPATWTSGFALDCLAPAAQPKNDPPPQPAQVPLPYGPNTCAQGFVWREASQYDETCVSPETRDQAAQQNGLAAQNREPGGGAYGPDTCRQGFVWREAFANDRVCVTPDDRAQAAADNAAASTHRATAN